MSYTAETLATFMATELAATGEALFGDDPATAPAIVEAVNEVAAVLGVSDVADVDDDLKLRTVARWQAWRAAKAAATGQYDLKAGSSSLARSQFFDHLAAMLADAETAALRYDEVAAVLAGGSTAAVSDLVTGGSPYAYPCAVDY
jgi:hypothetical protein